MKLNLTFFLLTGLVAFSTVRSEGFETSADHWNSLPQIAKEAYIYGFRDGTINAWIETKKEWLPKEENKDSSRIESVRKKIFTLIEVNELIETMDQLYSDSENSLIEPRDILFLARDKALGVDVSARLIQARNKADEDLHYRTHSEFKIGE